MPKVSNLAIAVQTGSDNTLYATWQFSESTVTTPTKATNRAIQPGDRVTVNRGSKWYNGASISSFVFNYQWIVLEVSGQRVVINRSTDGRYAIMSPIAMSNLTLVGASAASPAVQEVKANTFDHYEVKWYYSTGDGVWFDGSSETTENTNSIYSPAANAVKVKVTVTPVSKTYTSNGQTTSYWTGTPVSAERLMAENPPDTPSTPTVTIDKYTLTAKIENIEDAKAEEIEFEVYDGNSKFTSGTATVVTARASFTCAINAGGQYRVRCRAINYVGTSKVYSTWSAYSAENMTVPAAITGLRVSVISETSVKLTWNADNVADSYTVEYTTNRDYFDSSGEVSSMTVLTSYANLTGLESGEEWYFRVCGVNDEGEGGWSDIVYKVIGTKPEPPTTWSLTSTAVVGEAVILYWVHNTEDGSKQNEAQIELTVNGKAQIITIDTSEDDVDDDEVNKVYSYEVDMSTYTEGAEILWRVRTRGITQEYSDWSVQRSINVYAPPTLTMTLGDGTGELHSFPYTIAAIAGPNTQTAISYQVSITANNTYHTTDQIGNDVLVVEGEEVFSRVFNLADNNFSYDLQPQDLTLENNYPYTVTMTVSMNSGLIATATGTFVVNWDEEMYEPTAIVTFDRNNLCAYIAPYCADEETNTLIQNVTLAVYRREFDGSFTEIGSNILNNGFNSITDPHPSLDFARYRIVARSTSTNSIGFVDLPAQPVNIPYIVIQWDEEWVSFDYNEEAAPDIPSWSGSMLKLPYNVDVQESYNPDAVAVEYIGRKYPVGYYGTQKGITGQWSCEVPKNDKETIYALRRLANYSGDVYVRETARNGYNAQIKVSMQINHLNLTVPVTLSITRVEGGI